MEVLAESEWQQSVNKSVSPCYHSLYEHSNLSANGGIFILNALHIVLYALTTDDCTVDHHIRCNHMTREGREVLYPVTYVTAVTSTEWACYLFIFSQFWAFGVLLDCTISGFPGFLGCLFCFRKVFSGAYLSLWAMQAYIFELSQLLRL